MRKRAQGPDIILHGGPTGECSRGLVYRALWRLRRRAPFSIRALLSNMGSPFTGNSERYLKGGSGNVHLYGSSVRGTWRGASLLSALKVAKGRLWEWAFLFMGVQLGNLECAHLPGNLRDDWKGFWRWSVSLSHSLSRTLSLSLSLCGSSVRGTWREGSLAGDPEGYVEKALETGISFHRGPFGNMEEGSSTGDFESWLKGALGMEHLSLKRLRRRGLRRSSFTGDPGRYVKNVSGYGYHSPLGPLSIRGEPGMLGGSLIPRTLTDEWRTLVVVHLSTRDSIKGTLREGSFTGAP